MAEEVIEEGAEESAPYRRRWLTPLLYCSGVLLGWSLHGDYTTHKRTAMVHILDTGSSEEKVCALVQLINGDGQKEFDECMNSPDSNSSDKAMLVNPENTKSKITVT